MALEEEVLGLKTRILEHLWIDFGRTVQCLQGTVVQVNCEDAIFKLGLDRIQIHIAGQSEMSPEFSVRPLQSVPVITLLLLLAFPLPTDSQNSVLFHLDLDLILLQPGDVQGDHVAFRCFFPILSCRRQSHVIVPL